MQSKGRPGKSLVPLYPVQLQGCATQTTKLYNCQCFQNEEIEEEVILTQSLMGGKSGRTVPPILDQVPLLCIFIYFIWLCSHFQIKLEFSVYFQSWLKSRAQSKVDWSKSGKNIEDGIRSHTPRKKVKEEEKQVKILFFAMKLFLCNLLYMYLFQFLPIYNYRHHSKAD